MFRGRPVCGHGFKPDFAAAAGQLGLLPRLQRKPWVVLDDTRQEFEKFFGLTTDRLLVALAQWFGSVSGAPSAVGLAHVSGNVYLGPVLREPFPLSAEQTLLANLFSHGEIGLEAIASPFQPNSAALSLLQEVSTFRRLRWLDATSQVVLGQKVEEGTDDFAKPQKAGLFKQYPLVSSFAASPGGHGDCLQHPGFVHHDLSGTSTEEMQASLAQIALARSYWPISATEAGSQRSGCAGCALRTAEGTLVAGSSIVTQQGVGTMSPLQVALVSHQANARDASSVEHVAWMSASSLSAEHREVALRLRKRDEALLRAVAPGATFQVLAE